MTADNFLTEDVVRLTPATATNRAVSAFAKELERQLSGVGGGLVSIPVDIDTDKEPEIPLKASIEALELVHCPDCGRPSKIQPALAMSMFVCPYCGIGQFNERYCASIKVLLYEHHNVAKALLRSDCWSLGAALTRYLNYIDLEPLTKPFVGDCVQNHLPAGFDAGAEVDEVK